MSSMMSATVRLRLRAMPLILSLSLLICATAHAQVPVVELSESAAPADAPLRVQGRAPQARFLAGPIAQASSKRVANVADVGTRTNGKIVGFDPQRGRYSCSGTALNTPSRSIVLTAGHCVIEHGNAGTRLAFVPAYDHGTRPFGSYMVKAVYVMPQWRRGENPDFDVAALEVEPSKLGLLTDVVGARGYAIAKSRFAAFQIFGYPAAALRGEELRSCRAHGLGSDPLTFTFPGPPTIPSSCDMAAGASGGAWLVGGEYVNGVTSYSYVGRPTRLHSPYFGPAVGNFLATLP
jgi:V8-like Glu-specific endopeptidase